VTDPSNGSFTRPHPSPGGDLPNPSAKQAKQRPNRKREGAIGISSVCCCFAFSPATTCPREFSASLLPLKVLGPATAFTCCLPYPAAGLGYPHLIQCAGAMQARAGPGPCATPNLHLQPASDFRSISFSCPPIPPDRLTMLDLHFLQLGKICQLQPHTLCPAPRLRLGSSPQWHTSP